jgi:hypothetical protein
VIAVGVIEESVRREIGELDGEATAPGLAAAALKLAQHLDETDAPTAAAVVSRDLRALLLDLRKLAPVKSEGDGVDDLSAQREERRKRAARLAAAAGADGAAVPVE